jgi:hypothetical protein
VAAAITFVDWRRGLFVAVLIALIQDPLRKLTPDQPVVYVALVGVAFGFATLSALMSGVPLAPKSIWGWRKYLEKPFWLFIGILTVQGIYAYLNVGVISVPLIGLLSYLTPFAALFFVYQTIVRSPEAYLSDFIRFYVVCIALALCSVYLEFAGYGWKILGNVGDYLYIYSKAGRMITYAGIFRSSEVAAWHAATCVCLFAIWMLSRRLTVSRVIASTIFVLAVVALGVITGRRKFLVEIVVFIAAYATLLLYLGRGAKLALLSGFIGLMGYIAFTAWVPDESVEHTIHRSRGGDEQYREYVVRSKGVFSEIPERFAALGIAPISWAYKEYGFFGAGLGVGSQGTSQFGLKTQYAAEGGLGKIWVELGGIGLVITLWLGWALARHIWWSIRIVNSQSAQLSRISCGLASFLIANLATFAVATQIYGDIFVLLLLGTALGALLAMPVIAGRSLLQKQILGLAPGSPSPARRKMVGASNC